MGNDLTIEVPILIEHDYSRVIGKLSIDTSALPEKPHFVLALGYVLRPDDDTYELTEVSLVSDASYLEYLKSDRHQTHLIGLDLAPKSDVNVVVDDRWQRGK